MRPFEGKLEKFSGAIVIAETIHKPTCALSNYATNKQLVEAGKDPLPEPEGGWKCNCDPETNLKRFTNLVTIKQDESKQFAISELTLFIQTEKEQ